MIYMTWVLLRSIQAGYTFKREYLMRRPSLVMLAIWSSSMIIYIPFVFLFGFEEYTIRIDFNPIVEMILNIITWLLPLIGVAGFSFNIVTILNRRRLVKLRLKDYNRQLIKAALSLSMISTKVENKTQSSSNDHRPSPQLRLVAAVRTLQSIVNWQTQTRFELIILTFWLQWMPFCLVSIIQPACNCVPSILFAVLDWMTYSASLTNPIVTLLVNSHVVIFKRSTKT